MRAIDLPPDQRTILITGCSSGIGHHCAIALNNQGYRVFACARKEEDVVKLQSLGLNAFQMDLQHSESIKSALEQILVQSGNQLFALFNNAGYAQPGAVEDITRALLREQFETNLFGTSELTNLVLPVMRAQGYGRVIQNSSMLGLVSLPFRGAYNASKHALEALTDTLRLELTGSPIHISTLEPGPIQSRFRYNAFQQFLKNIHQESSPFSKVYALLNERLSNQTIEPPFTLGPKAVESVLLKALNAKRPKAHYYITVPTYVFGFLKRVLCDRMLDFVLLRSAGKEGALISTRELK